MHKRMFLSVLVALSIVNFGAFAAPNARGNARGTAAANNAQTATTNAAAPVAARAGARQKVVANTGTAKTTTNAAAAPKVNGARAAATKKVATPTVKTNATAAPSTGKPMAARAGATQKVIQTGTKVATATTNTTVPQECQDAFYGCMDAFCMLDNASGGRCQCSDRITELDKVLEDILKLDEQSYIMATEGVERLQMGEAEEQIMARAKAAADRVTIDDKKAQNSEESKKKVRQLDLSAWNTNVFSADDDDDIFGASDASDDLVDTFADKKGDELYKSAAKMCIKQIPAQCNASGQMMQLVYAQRIKSDCAAYENSLKQQKIASTQKLQTAQKALRDAALDEYKDQNKYADLGSCVVALKQCVQSTGECGADFSGCVADNATLNVLYKSGNASSIAVKKLTNSVTISQATYDNLESAALKCESVVRQCVNVNKGKDILSGDVFKQFIKDVAPAVYSVEYSMASNARMNCITTIINCVKTSCKSAGMEEGSTNYDACLSNPESIKNYCALEIPKCGDALSQQDVLSYVSAKLAADKVDACTEQVRSCLTADTACGADYSNCIGLDTETIADLCPADKLTACQTNNRHGEAAETEIRDYVNKIAKGLSLQIDNNLLASCQKAADDAMIKVCGATDDCGKFALDKNIGATSLKYQVCQVIVGKDENNNPTYTVNEGACKDNAEQITKQEMGLDTMSASTVAGIGSMSSGSSSWGFGVVIPFVAFGGGRSDSQSQINFVRYSKYTLKPGETTMYSPYLKGTIDWGTQIKTTSTKDATTGLEMINFACADESKCDDNMKNIVLSLNNSIDRMIKSIESDTKVQYCMTGRSVQTTSGAKLSNKNDGKGDARFPQLTSSMRQIIANNVYNTALNNYNEKLAELEQKRDSDYLTIASKYEEVAAQNDEKALAQRLATQCSSLTRDNSTWNYKETISATYSESSKICTKTTRTQKCKFTTHASNPGRRACVTWADPEEKTEQLRM